MPRSPKPSTPHSASTGHAGDRTVDRAPGQRCPLPRRPVPGVAVSPVLHRHRRAGRCRRYHPPPPRHHRNRVRRPHRRTAGAYALGTLRRELGLDPVRGDRAQPAARHRRARRRAHTAARGATLRRRIVNIPARLARPQRRPVLHLPSHWPWAQAWTTLWHNTIGASARHHNPSPPDHRRQGPTGAHRKSWADQQIPAAHDPETTAPPSPDANYTDASSVGWPGGIAPPGSHRSRRDSLPSPGSCHPGRQTRATEGVQAQCANMRGYRTVIPRQHSMAFLSARNRLYFLRIQRTK